MNTFILEINNKYFKNQNIDNFVGIVFNNFNNLSDNDKLKHSVNEIKRLLLSDKFIGLLIKYKNYTIAYLLGEIIKLNDSRTVLFINYLYVSNKFRRNGFASKLLNKIIEISKNLKVDTVMLICDTQNNLIYDFYLKRGFMLDLNLRRYEKHDVLSLSINF